MLAPGYLEAFRPLIEATVGRRLRAAEQIVDVFHLTRLLDHAKDEIEQAIRREQARAVSVAVRNQTHVRLQPRAVMVAPLDRLYRLGQAEAAAELERAGYTLPRSYAASWHDTDRPDPVQHLQHRLAAQLGGLSTKITNEYTTQLQIKDQGTVADAIARALLRVLGARSIASSLVSTALFSGMGATFEENQDLVAGWEYSAVLDGGTCDVCEGYDGSTYDSWDAIQDVLPDGGPNPDCLGGDRCRCRAVPAPA